MHCLQSCLRRDKKLRAIGFDDAPFTRVRGGQVNVAGVVCSDTRFEGMVWGQAQKDGGDATEVLSRLVSTSKFANQIHLLLLDGLAVGGFNIVDLRLLADTLQRPCIAVMRKAPNLEAIDKALRNFADYAERRALIRRAGDIYRGEQCFFQVCGCDPGTAAQALSRLTDTGYVPEPLRLAHLIGAAVVTGQSSRRA